MTRPAFTFAFAFALAGCAPSSQVLLHVDTDAPVPAAPGAPLDPSRPPPLFDQLRIEVLHRDGSPAATGSGAARDFAVDAQAFAEQRVSAGIAPQPGDGDLVVRVRLYRGDRLFAGQPPPSSTLSTTVALPPLDTAGVTDVTVRLLTEDVGRPRGSPGSPLDPALGVLDASSVGTWSGAQVVPCAGATPAGMACVPGGAYWMGDPLIKGVAPDVDADQERLVVVSPFFLDLHEVTVADYRKRQVPFLGHEWNGTQNPSMLESWCTFSAAASAADPTDTHAQLPLSCIYWQGAKNHCTALGKRLPSEAEFEMVASGRGEERAYPWGADVPACPDAVRGRAGIGFHAGDDGSCVGSGDFGGPVPPGAGARDRVLLDGQEVLDLAGNLAEWTADRFSRQYEPYWGHPGVFRDPVGDYNGVDTDTRTLRGGAWVSLPVALRSAYRQPGTTGTSYSDQVGFRCAKDAR